MHTRGQNSMSFHPTQIEALIETGQCILSEQGRTSGVTYRERYTLPDGRYVDVTRDQGVGNNQIVAYAIRTTRKAHWQTAR